MIRLRQLQKNSFQFRIRLEVESVGRLVNKIKRFKFCPDQNDYVYEGGPAVAVSCFSRFSQWMWASRKHDVDTIMLKIISTLFLFILLPFQNTVTNTESAVTWPDPIYDILHAIDSRRAATIDSFFSERFNRHAFNGTVLFAENGRIIYEHAFGLANFKQKDSLKINSGFQLASVSKPLTAFAVMMLAEKGKLSYDDDVRKFFPNFPYADITIRLLLIHRSGLPNYMYFADKYWPDRSVPITNSDVVELMEKYHPAPNYRPNTRYNYSNTNYALLASIVEKVSGMDFRDFMKKYIFKPLAMNHTFIYRKTQTTNVPQEVVGYTRRRRVAEDSYLNGVVGDKGVYSTVEDLLNFDQALYNGTLVSRKSLEQAFQPAHKDLHLDDNYGFGWRVSIRKDGEKVVYHAGWWKGFKTYFIRLLDEHRTIIVLSNQSRPYHFRIDRLNELF